MRLSAAFLVTTCVACVACAVLDAPARGETRGKPGNPGGQLDGRSFRLQRTAPDQAPVSDELFFDAGKVELKSLGAAASAYSMTKEGAVWTFKAKLRGAAGDSFTLAGTVKGRHLDGTLVDNSRSRSGSKPVEARLSGELITLYERLGGEAVIASIVDDLLARFHDDKVISANPHVLEARAHGDRKAIRGHFVTFFCRLTGGPQTYEGRSMHDSHVHLKITRDEWQSGLADLDAVLDQHQLPKRERAELRDLVAGTRPDIVAP